MLAAKQAGMTELPVLWVDCDDDRALRILLADNRTNDLADYNPAALTDLLKELAETPDALVGTGYDGDALDELLADLEPEGSDADAEPKIDKAEELRKKWGTEPGQLWELGDHRLLCGDSTKAEDVARVMGGGRAECVWTDPPYGVDYVGKTKNARTIQNDGTESTVVEDSLLAACAALAPSARFYLAAPPGPRGFVFRLAITKAGWRLHQELVWRKNCIVLGHSDYHYQHEPILYGYLPGDGRPGRGDHEGTRWYGDHSQSSVLDHDKPTRSEEHPTMKPVGLVVHCLQNSTRHGDVVYEPFSGSGTTIIACEQLGRKCRAIEISPAYVAVALERWATATGKTPALVPGGSEGDG
jgi:site-specific DNA-methyltransferase (adenine-specific)